MDAILEELLTLERAGWDALCSSSGAGFYGDLMTEDGVMVLADGSVFDRAAVVTSLDGAPAWDEYTIDDPRLVRVGDEAALVYAAEARRGDTTFVARMSSVYVHEGDRWRLALYQQTPTGAAG
ncbi:nuclear transport factor 2 family protein [Aeromicrobium sp. YIM 150415]|uniref:nuclear transport factor 2 family protein n=1 Tax=Aeromicrobium sp. YIM 150415 TaxID=2803912 RepID=UPI001F055E8A|nr:nuclear transport factor 2 family protein [Aeromicrobium sp. YIM 150415]